MKIVLDEFHPLDHTLLECKGYPGGRRRHLKYAWEFLWREQLEIVAAHSVGRHAWRGWAARDMTADVETWKYGVNCAGCDAVPSQRVAAQVLGNMRNDRKFIDALSAISTAEFDNEP